jgi:t-SNARE complex subunit (syntaxin)
LKLRKNEKKHYLKVQEIHDDGGKFQTHKEREQFLNDTSAMELAQEEDELDMTHRVKNKEIKNLVNTINDLAVLFKDLSVLVIE